MKECDLIVPTLSVGSDVFTQTKISHSQSLHDLHVCNGINVTA